MPIDQPLHLRIEVLHADRDSSKAKIVQELQLLSGSVSGMDLDRCFKSIVSPLRGCQNRLQNTFEILSRKECRRTPAQMDAEQRPLSQSRNSFDIQAPLFRQQFDVRSFASMIARNHRIACTKSAKRFTKRQM